MIKTEDMTTSSLSPSSSPLVMSSQQQTTMNSSAASSNHVGSVKAAATPAQANADDFDNNDFNDTMIGIDLEKEKKLLAASTTKMSNLDQIRACKDEKFLNIVILHKKFVDIGKF